MSVRDLALEVSSQLAGDWSASSVTGLLSAAAVQELSSSQKWQALDPMVRVRLLLSPMFLRRQELSQLRGPLQALTAAAVCDADEWIRVAAAAVGPYDGRLHMAPVVQRSKLVQSTLEETRRRGEAADPSLFRPLEEMYLSAEVLKTRGAGGAAAPAALPSHAHFTPRDPATAPGAAAAAPPPSTASKSAAVAAPQRSTFPATAGPSGLGKPPIGPGPPLAGRRTGISGIFLDRKKPPSGLRRASVSASGNGGVAGVSGGRVGIEKPRKKAAVLDLAAVAQLKKHDQEEAAKRQKEAEEAREAAARAKVEAKAAEKREKEEKKQRIAAKAAAEAAAAKEEREAERARKETEAAAAKEEAAKKKAEDQAEREAKRAKREAEKAEKEAAKAAREEAKRAAAERETEAKSDRPAKAAKTHAGAAPGSALAMAQAQGERVIEPGVGGGPPLVQLMDPQLALAALREAEALMATGGGGMDPNVLRYMQLMQQHAVVQPPPPPPAQHVQHAELQHQAQQVVVPPGMKYAWSGVEVDYDQLEQEHVARQQQQQEFLGNGRDSRN